MNTITRYIRDNSSNQELLKSLNSSENLEVLEVNTINKSNETHFLSNDIDFFDLFYDSKFIDTIVEIKYVRKKTYF